MTPYYADDSVTLHHGSCLDVLADLPDASVDAVVTDPPYGLANTTPEKIAETVKRWMDGERDYLPGGKGFMGNPWDAFVPPAAVWDDCLRVLKPGGHVLAFAGSRTMDLMTLSLRLAGFDIRDSIAWLYGSGFPKSLDVSKAIDKAGGDPFAFRRFARAYAAAVASRPITHTDIDRHLGIKSSSCYWAREDHRGGMPPRHHWETVRDLLGLGGDLEALYDEAEREVVGEVTHARSGGNDWAKRPGEKATPRTVDVTVAATDEARHWEGWGTALKPAWESVVVARKTPSLLGRIGSHLDDLETQCRRLANSAGPSSARSPHGSPAARTSSAPANAATPHAAGQEPQTATGAEADSFAGTDTSWSAWATTTSLNIVTSWKRSLAVLSQPTSTSTIGTTSETTTALTTLWSSLSRLTEPSTLLSKTSPDGLSPLAHIVDDLFGAALLNWRATRTLTATEPATSATLLDYPDGGGRPQLEPVVVARKPFTGTVAANVLDHGTGALNIDACRVGTDDDLSGGGSGTGRVGAYLLGGYPTLEALRDGARTDEVTPDGKNRARAVLARAVATNNTRLSAERGGRWPANVVLDESQADALDQQSGNRPSGGGDRGATSRTGGILGPDSDRGRSSRYERGPDSGGASRFFYVAKAGKSERPNVDGVAHPTVKPLALMRWLVRLVTPPGGTVLEPFAGSGTTIEAALLEGFNVIGIEREAEYLPLIEARIARALATDTDLFGGAA